MFWGVLLFCFDVNCITAKEHILERITITYVNFNVLTGEDVDCDGFTGQFQKTGLLKILHVNNKKYVDEFENAARKFIQASKKHLDIRLKVIYIYSDETICYCMDKFGNFICEGRSGIRKNMVLYELLFHYIPVENKYILN